MAAEIEIHSTTTAAVDQADRDTHLSAGTIEAIAAGRAQSTTRADRADRADREAYARWCSAEGRTALPATAETLASYAAHLTTAPLPRTGRPASPSSIDRALSAIATLHAEHYLPKPSTVAARAVINGYKTRLALAKDPAAKPRKASPAVPAVLRAMLAGRPRHAAGQA